MTNHVCIHALGTELIDVLSNIRHIKRWSPYSHSEVSIQHHAKTQ
jgi:hypothetical protein